VKLRNQLFIVSLLLLAMPWAGCQYLKAVDEVMKQVQGEAVSYIAQSVAEQLAAQDDLWQQSFISSKDNAVVLYAVKAQNIMLVDGYEDDWRQESISSLVFNKNNINSEITISIQARNQQFYFLISVNDSDIQYFNPASNDLFSTDHLSFKILDLLGNNRIYHLYAGAPGKVIAQYRDDQGRLRSQNQIKGVWRENAKGYVLELEVDQQLLSNGFNIDIVHVNEDKTSVTSIGQNNEQLERTIKIITPAESLSNALNNIQLESYSATIINANRWVIAKTNKENKGNRKRAIPWIIEWFYRLLLNSKDLTSIDKSFINHQWDKENKISPNETTVSWHRSSSNIISEEIITRVVVPIFKKVSIKKGSVNKSSIKNSTSLNDKLGHLIVDNNNDHMISLTSHAFNRLLILSLGLFFVVGLGLLFYASWLSWRVRRLHSAAEGSINQQGLIKTQTNIWPDLANKDELGDLSRSYRKLLLQIEESQNYLRTLSSKLSHELRTPIAIVKSSLENLTQAATEEEKQEYQLRAREGIDRLSGILSAMSAANRIEESIDQAEFTSIDLQQMMEQLIQAYTDAYHPQEFIFTTKIDKNILGYKAKIAEDLFVQMIDKIIDNACGFSVKDQPIIVNLERTDEVLVLQFSNSGPLLPEAMEKNIFDSMTSLRASSRNHIHLGMGLYIVRLISELHQCQIQATNREDGSGVVFTLVIPAC
jgi:dedicated sortase system histidine kinase